MITSRAREDDHKLLSYSIQKSNLTARQPRRAPFPPITFLTLYKRVILITVTRIGHLVALVYELVFPALGFKRVVYKMWSFDDYYSETHFI